MQKQLKLKIALASRIKIHNVNFKLIPMVNATCALVLQNVLTKIQCYQDIQLLYLSA